MSGGPSAGRPGRPRVDDRKALAGILFVLGSGIPWEMLPREMGCAPARPRVRAAGELMTGGRESVGRA